MPLLTYVAVVGRDSPTFLEDMAREFLQQLVRDQGSTPIPLLKEFRIIYSGWSMFRCDRLLLSLQRFVMRRKLDRLIISGRVDDELEATLTPLVGQLQVSLPFIVY
jgi:hypothetical protein